MAPGVAVVIPARDEAARIGATVAAALRVPGVDLVVVVDDGSRDGTAELARAAGAQVVSHRRSRGKGEALETGADAVRVLDARDGVAEARALLLLDADLEDSAAKVAPLLEPVLSGAADLAVALLPPQASPGGGRGRVVRLARSGIAAATGFVATQPLSGQRALTRAAFDAARPLAPGFGVEVGMTVDLLRRGFRVVEVPVDLHHRVTGADLSGRLHRGRQLLHVARALAARGIVGERAFSTQRGAGGGSRAAGSVLEPGQTRQYGGPAEPFVCRSDADRAEGGAGQAAGRDGDAGRPEPAAGGAVGGEGAAAGGAGQADR